MRIFLIALLFFITSCGSLFARENITSTTINREKSQLMKMVSDPTGKKWVQAILGEYSNTLKSLSRRATNTDASDRLRYKNDIQNEAQIFIQNVKKGAFSFSIPSDEKTRVESDILSFQKSLISSVRASIEKQLDTDVKLFSTMNMSVENKE